MATHSSILAWRIPWTEEPGGPRAHRESDMTERLTLTILALIYGCLQNESNYKRTQIRVWGCVCVYVCTQTYPGSRMQVKISCQNSNSDSLWNYIKTVISLYILFNIFPIFHTEHGLFL